jgi:hypothetical protein
VRKEARKEAERLRDDARRARDEARRLRDQARREAHEERRRGPGQHGPGPRMQFHFEGEADGSGADRTEQTINMDGVRTVHLNQTAGKLSVRPCKEGESPGIVSSGSKTTPEIVVHRDGERLNIEVKLNKGWLFRRKQGATTVIRVADRAYDQFRIDNGYGETEVSSISATDLRVHVGAGSIQCLLTRGNLDVDVGAGKVSVLSHSGLARCDSGTGDVLLDIAEVAEGEYKVDVGLGRAEVRFPSGAEVFIRTASGIGKSRIEYPSAAEGAATRLRLNSGIGECVVKARDAGPGAPAPAQAPAGQAKPQRPGRAASASRRREAEEMRVLQMLEQGKITPQDAADLIAALQGSTTPQFEDEEPDAPTFH